MGWVTYVTGQVDAEALAPLHTIGEVVRSDGPDAAPWHEVAPTVNAVLLRGGRMDATMLAEAPHLTIVARHGAGHDSVDLDAARRLGIAVTTTPGANAPSVAEHAIALLLAVARRVGEADNLVKIGEWQTGRRTLVGRELSGGTLGIVASARSARRPRASRAQASA